ncbi:hypothetical protein GCM10023075_64890 [Streptosporangium album]
MTRAKKQVRTATRKCATCGQAFTWTSRNPKRRFCDPICKARWWRASNNDGDTAASTDTAELTTNTRQPHTDSTTEVGTANAVTIRTTRTKPDTAPTRPRPASRTARTATNRSPLSTCSSRPRQRTSTRRHNP